MAAPTPEASEIYIGLMSGTSVDGVDAVLADFSADRPKVLAHVYQAFDADLRAQMLRLCTSGADEIELAGAASLRLAEAYAGCVRSALGAASLTASDVRAIGAHGQTVRHRPDVGFTVQLNAPAHLAEATGIDVIADFRSRDLAAGGQGAPLVAAFHAAAFGADSPRAVVNIGGISNVTFLPAGTQPTLGFDCGPGNVLLDLNAARHLGTPMDRDGKWAEQGRADEALLSQLLVGPLFREAPAEKHRARALFGHVARCRDPRQRRASRRAAHVDRTDRTSYWRCDRPLVRHGRRGRRLRRRHAQSACSCARLPQQSLPAHCALQMSLEFRPIRSKPSPLPGSLGALSDASPARHRQSPVRAGPEYWARYIQPDAAAARAPKKGAPERPCIRQA